MRLLFAVAGWVAAAGAAMLIGLAGVQVIGSGITSGTGGDVLTAEQAARELAAASPAPPLPSSSSAAPTATPTAAPGTDEPANVRAFGGPGGTVRAGCLPGGAVLVNWSPAQGYRVEEYRRGPGEYAEVRFDQGGSSGRGNDESRVRVRCVGGVPTASWD